MVYPDGGRSGGPVAVDDEGGGAGQVEERLGGQVVVVELTAAVEVEAGVEQQPDVQAGSHEAVGQVEVCEVIAGLSRPALLLAWTWKTFCFTCLQVQKITRLRVGYGCILSYTHLSKYSQKKKKTKTKDTYSLFTLK